MKKKSFTAISAGWKSGPSLRRNRPEQNMSKTKINKTGAAKHRRFFFAQESEGGKPPEEQKDVVKRMVALPGDEGVAFDCNAYKDATAGLRFWCGATVEADDVRKLCSRPDWAYDRVKSG